MTHADELARLRDAVVDAAKSVAAAECEDGPGDCPGCETYGALLHAVDALLAAEAATCGKCGGDGFKKRNGRVIPGVVCDCGGTGRKPRDRFRDDSATTPEGNER